MTVLDPPRRCDGCGCETNAAIEHVDDEGTVLATYCPGCDSIRELRDVAPGEHEQHRLLEAGRDE